MALPLVDVSSPILQAYFQGVETRRRREQDQRQAQVESEQMKIQEEREKRLEKQATEQLKLQQQAQELNNKYQQEQLKLRNLESKQKGLEFVINTRAVPKPDNLQQQLGDVGMANYGMTDNIRGAEYTNPLEFMGQSYSPEELKLANSAIGRFESQEKIAQDRIAAQAEMTRLREDSRASLAAQERAHENELWEKRFQSQMDLVDRRLSAKISGESSLEKAMSLAQKASGIRSLTEATFRGEAYKAWRERNEAVHFVDAMIKDPSIFKGPAALSDLGLAYAFARGQDPNRVTDMELKMAIEMSMPAIEAAGLKMRRFFGRAPMFDDASRKRILEVVRKRRDAAKHAYGPHRRSVAAQLRNNYKLSDEEISEYLQDDYEGTPSGVPAVKPGQIIGGFQVLGPGGKK
jgi:hypothetical protein